MHDIFGHWTLSKSKVKEEETFEAGATRALLQEVGLAVVIEDELGSNEYVASQPETGKVRRQVQYFLAKAPYQDIEFLKQDGLHDV